MRPSALLASAAVAGATCASGCAHCEPGPDPTEANRGFLDREPAPARAAELARMYAPVIFHAAHPTLGRQDVIGDVDFDGNLAGNDDWEDLDRFRLRPTVYYCALETETHAFISYHVFHPRDWNTLTVYLNDTHENDGENLQVVVRKKDGAPVALWTQAHYTGWVYANEGSGVSAGALEEIEAPLLLLDDEGRPSPSGRHVAVFVQSEGHGIYGALDCASGVRVAADGAATFAKGSGLVWRAAAPGEEVAEPARTDAGEARYLLVSSAATLWPRLRDGTLVGDGRLLDGAWPYEDARVSVGVPRYYDGDRASGPLGPDRGISPFALDFEWRAGALGSLYFDPARRWPEALTIAGPWARAYIDDPFLPSATARSTHVQDAPLRR